MPNGVILSGAFGALVVAGVIVVAFWAVRMRQRQGELQRQLGSLRDRLKKAEEANNNLAGAFVGVIGRWSREPTAPSDIKEIQIRWDSEAAKQREIQKRVRSQAPESRASSSPIQSR